MHWVSGGDVKQAVTVVGIQERSRHRPKHGVTYTKMVLKAMTLGEVTKTMIQNGEEKRIKDRAPGLLSIKRLGREENQWRRRRRDQ